jgi:hypothetical protein
LAGGAVYPLKLELRAVLQQSVGPFLNFRADGLPSVKLEAWGPQFVAGVARGRLAAERGLGENQHP